MKWVGKNFLSGHLGMFEGHCQVSGGFASVVLYGCVGSQLQQLQDCIFFTVPHCYRQSLTDKNTVALLTFCFVISDKNTHHVHTAN